MFAKASARSLIGSEHILLLALKLVSFIGFIFMAFGPRYSYMLLACCMVRDGMIQRLQQHWVAIALIYIMALAVNGTTEAFLHALVTRKQLLWSNAWLTLFSVVYMSLSVLLIRAAGSIGLIMANALNMAMRIVYSVIFIRSFFKDSSTFRLQSFSRLLCLTVLLGSALVKNLSNKYVLDEDRFSSSGILHVSIGCACLATVVASVYEYEKSFLRELSRLKGCKADTKSE